MVKEIRLNTLRGFKRHPQELNDFRAMIKSGISLPENSDRLSNAEDSLSSIYDSESGKLKLSPDLQKKTIFLFLKYFNEIKEDRFGRDSENLSLSFYLVYLSKLILDKLNEMKETSSDTDLEALELFISLVRQFTLISNSLSCESRDFLLFITNELGHDFTKEQILSQQIRNTQVSLVELDIISFLKAGLNYIMINLAKGSPVGSFITEVEIDKIVSNSSSRVKRMFSKTARSGVDLISLRSELKRSLTLFKDNLEKLTTLLLSCSSTLRIVLIPLLISLFYSNRAVKTREKIDEELVAGLLKTIDSGDLIDITEGQIEEALPNLDEICSDLARRVDPNNYDFSERNIEDSPFLFVSGSSGPNSQSSVLNLPFDAQALLRDPELLQEIISLGEEFGIIITDDFMEEISNIPVPDISASEDDIEMDPSNAYRKLKYDPIHSKLFMFIEPGGKKRVVAEVDGFSQTVLNPIHEVFSDISTTLDFQSAHFDQENSFLEMSKLARKNGFIGTFDLTAATDLLPIKIQQRIVESVFKQRFGKPGIGELWSNVISKFRKFHISGFMQSDEEAIEPVSYKIGQPMGAKSSWLLLHFTMYVIMYQGAMNVAKRGDADCDFNELVKNFNICGDDQSVTHPELYKEVKSIMKKLDLKINESKSFESYADKDEKGSRLFGEYLKKFVLDKDIFVPSSPRKASKFFVSPRTFLCSFSQTLHGLNLNVDMNDLFLYAMMKDYDCQSDGKVLPNQNKKTFVKRYQFLTEQLFFYLLGDNSIGGVSLPPRVLKDYCLSNKNLYFNQLLINYDISDPNSNLRIELLRSKISQIFSSSQSRADKAILSIFSPDMLRVFKDVYNTKGQNKNPKIRAFLDDSDLSIFEDSDEISSMYSRETIGKVFLKHPLHLQIMKILFSQKLDVLNKIRSLRDDMGRLNLDTVTESQSPKIISTLKTVLVKCKRKLNPIDLESLMGTTISERDALPASISRKMISRIKELSLIKEVTSTEGIIINISSLEDISNNKGK